MATRSIAAPPTLGPQTWARPAIETSADVRALSQMMGNVRVGTGAIIAPGALIQAEADAPFSVGAGSLIQGSAVVQGSAHGRVLGDDDQPYSIWIGAEVCITHKVVVQGPAYIGDRCFIGFRSTIFNARLGKGCVVMMHALVQDVEIPAGRFVPSGSVISRQEQADALPKVQPEDLAFVQDVVTASRASGAQYGTASVGVSSPAMSESRDRPPSVPSSHDNGSRTMQPHKLTPDIVQQVRQLLSQGYRIGTEHADSRRYRSNVWQTCTPVQSTREPEVLGALEACLEEHAGEYVRMFGIDPVAKCRVATTTIQRPDGKPVHVQKTAVAAAGTSSSSPATPSDNGNDAGLSQHVRQLLNQGCRVGIEYADPRRYRSNVWQTCTPVSSTREADVLAAVQQCLAEHAGDYVRIFGIDANKHRVQAITIQRPDGKPMSAAGGAVGSGPAVPVHAGHTAPGGGLTPEVMDQVRQFLRQGYQIGTEHADQRRYRSNVWQTCTPIQAKSEGEVFAALHRCLADHAGEYVRLFGIDPAAKRRLAPVTIQHPNGSAPQVAAPSRAAASPSSPSSHNGSARSAVGGSASLGNDVVQQVQQLVGQGYRISLEHADVRRYRSGVWQTSGMIEGRGSSDVLAALEAGLRAHAGEYVRLVGIDPQAKRRVLETTIQRP